MEKIFHPHEINEQVKTCVEGATLKKNNSKNIALSLEAKTELRGQIGFMANHNTYLVAPRTALGGAATLNFFDYANKHNVTISDFGNENNIDKTKSAKISFLNASLNAFREQKIMPIAMSGLDDPARQVMCHPLPLFEESDQRLPFNHNEISRKFHLDDKALHKKIFPL
ncbi:hypothetical protein ABK905_15290 [Acerihabitans sp. KWT182]|uniref:Uncharacterized protein n=1 Tax=Acerihabitans sp. KWT182 TaxID=3157919 RepID=A0AAU7Q501_9GAMM